VKPIQECELCGSKKANKRTKIDNAILTVCDKCVNFGEVVPTVELKPEKKIIPKLEELDQVIKPDFKNLIKNERNRRNLTQEELAKKLNEKESLIKRIEDGWEPSFFTVKKLEKFFNIKLTEEIEEKQIEKKTDKKELTIGDIVEIH
jgi:putative transcription factor